MNLNNMRLGLEQVLGSASAAILVSQREAFLYENGAKTDKKQAVALVCSPANDFEKISVKLTGVPLAITNEALAEANANLDFTWVSFQGFSASVYTDRASGEAKLSAKAASIYIVSEKEDL